MRQPRLVADARRIESSGIGRYLRAVLGSPDRAACRLTVLAAKRPDPAVFGTAPDHWSRFPVSGYHPLNQVLLPLRIPPCDAFFSPHFDTTCLPVRASRRVVTVHDAFHLSGAASFSRAGTAYARFLLAAAVRTADAVIAVSEFTAAEIARHFPECSGRIRVVRNAVDGTVFFPDPQHPGIEGPYALFVGNLKPHKNLETAVRALEHCGDGKLKLVVAGASSGFITGMGGRLEALKGNPRIVWAGTPDDRVLRRLYSHAECLLFPSFYEGFGYPAVEAMSCGCPVVCSDIEALRETCADAAVFSDPQSPQSFGRAMAEMRGDRQARAEWVRRGRQRAAGFSLKAFQEQTWRILLQ